MRLPWQRTKLSPEFAALVDAVSDEHQEPLRELLQAVEATRAEQAEAETEREQIERERRTLPDTSVDEYLGSVEKGEHARRAAELEQRAADNERSCSELEERRRRLEQRAGDSLEAAAQAELAANAALVATLEADVERHRLAIARVTPVLEAARDHLLDVEDTARWARLPVESDRARERWEHERTMREHEQWWRQVLADGVWTLEDAPRYLRKRLTARSSVGEAEQRAIGRARSEQVAADAGYLLFDQDGLAERVPRDE